MGCGNQVLGDAPADSGAQEQQKQVYERDQVDVAPQQEQPREKSAGAQSPQVQELLAEFERLPPYEKKLFGQLAEEELYQVKASKLASYLAVRGVQSGSILGDSLLTPTQFKQVVDGYYGQLAPEALAFYEELVVKHLNKLDKGEWYRSYAARLREFGAMPEEIQEVFGALDEPGEFLLSTWQLYVVLRRDKDVPGGMDEFVSRVERLGLKDKRFLGPGAFLELYESYCARK